MICSSTLPAPVRGWRPACRGGRSFAGFPKPSSMPRPRGGSPFSCRGGSGGKSTVSSRKWSSTISRPTATATTISSSAPIPTTRPLSRPSMVPPRKPTISTGFISDAAHRGAARCALRHHHDARSQRPHLFRLAQPAAERSFWQTRTGSDFPPIHARSQSKS